MSTNQIAHESGAIGALLRSPLSLVMMTRCITLGTKAFLVINGCNFGYRVQSEGFRQCVLEQHQREVLRRNMITRFFGFSVIFIAREMVRFGGFVLNARMLRVYLSLRGVCNL